MSRDSLLVASDTLWKYVIPSMMFTGLVGNSISFCVMLGRRFRTQTIGVYFGALAMVDSYNLMNSLPRFWFPMVLKIDPASYSDIGCRISTFSLYYSYQVSSWVLVCVTVERALAVAFPLKTKNTFTRKRAVITLVTVASLLLAYNSYILFYKAGYLDEMPDGSLVCTLNAFYTDKPFFKSHNWIDVLLCSIIPFTCIIVSNVVIVRKVMESRKLTKKQEDKNSSTTSMKMLLCVSSMFIFFTLPLSIMLLYMQTYQVLDVENDGLPSLLWVIGLILLYGNNSLNFFLYCLTGRTFRKQLCDYFSICRRTKSDVSRVTGTSSLESGSTFNNDKSSNF